MDEIGSSTEPGEGAALARAVLEKFRGIGALAIATTHYNRLKMYAETTPEVANAAMEFNELTLEPTYRLLHGLAGASSGLKIAERLNMPAGVLQNANTYLETGEVEAAHYVEELRRRITELEAEKAALAAERREFDAQQQQERAALQKQQRQEIERLERRLEEIVRQMSEKAERDLQALQDEGLQKKFQRRLDSTRAQAMNQVREEKSKVLPPSGPSGKVPGSPGTTSGPVQIGSQVRIISAEMTGKVAAITGAEAEVMVGNIRMRRPMEDLEVIEKPAIRLPAGVHLTVASRELESNEINLLGCRVEEAVERVDKFLDEASLAQVPQVRIVHGTGTGALRNAIIALLRDHPQVARFESPQQSAGGRGVTIATLRD
jgi:DNA mismatch repair protein MutS2